MFERIAIMDPGGAAARCLQSLQTRRTPGAGPRTLLVHGGAEPLGPVASEVDEVVVLPWTTGAAGAHELNTWLGQADVDAVWVGWGAPHEHLAVATACEAAGVRFVGPSAEALGAAEQVATRQAMVDHPGSSPRAQHVGCRHVEVQLLGDDHDTIWTLGTILHSARADGRTVLSGSADGALGPATTAACERAAIDTARRLGLRGAVAVDLAVHDREPTLVGVRAYLTPAHTLTELATGMDVIARQFALAAGQTLTGTPPRRGGHACGTTLRLDELPHPAPATTVVERLETPFFPGLRCDLAVAEGDALPAGLGAELVTFSATGPDRTSALARLKRAVARCTVTLEVGATDRAALLDGLRALGPDGDARPAPRTSPRPSAPAAANATRAAIAIVVAAIETDDLATTRDRERFLVSAARGRAEAPPPEERPIDLQIAGHRYSGLIGATGPRTYALRIEGHLLDASLVRGRGPHRSVHIGGNDHAVVSTRQGDDRLVIVDGAPIRVVGRPGDSEGAPLAPTAPSALPALRAMGRATGRPPRVRHATTVRLADARRLRELVLGFDRDPGHPPATAPGDASGAEDAATDDGGGDPRATETQILDAELEVLRAFTDVNVLTRNRRPADGSGDLGPPSAGEELRTYLRTLDEHSAGLSERFGDQLVRALTHLEVRSLERSPTLEAALHRLHIAQHRAPSHLPALLALLGRWLDDPPEPDPSDAGPPDADPPDAEPPDAEPPDTEPPDTEAPDARRDALDHLIRATEVRYPAVGELARRVRYRRFDRPRLAREREHALRRARERLNILAEEHDPVRRMAAMTELVAASPRLLPLLHDPTVTDTAIAPLLEAITRCLYRRHQLRELRILEVGDHPVVVAEVPDPDAPHNVVAVVGDDLYDLLALAGRLTDGPPADPSTPMVLDAYVCWPDAPVDRGGLVAALLPQLAAAPATLHRVTVTTVTVAGRRHDCDTIQQLTFERGPDGWVERRHLRGIHPLVAERLDLWRFERFELTRLASGDDVHLWRAIAHEDGADVRLFAVAEVRDLTPTRDASGGITALPELERVLAACLHDLRRARAAYRRREQPDWNRIVLDVWPVVDIPRDQLDTLVRALAPLATGLGLEEVTLLARSPGPGGGTVRRCLRLTPTAGHGMTLRITHPPRQPLRPMDALTREVRQARRAGAIHPTELIPSLTTAPADERSPPARPGRFQEHDLDDAGQLRPVTRDLGQNAAGIVVGVVTTPTERHPGGLVRVALLNDVTRHAGSLAEPECRRIVAALDLAEALEVPVEWFATSSGARIAMDSGTENLDWTARVLRRTVAFTRAGGEINVVVTGVDIGAQPLWHAEATMLMHTKGILIMTPDSAMLLTGKRELDHTGSVAAEDDIGLGGYEDAMGGNGQAAYWAPDPRAACSVLFDHYDLSYVAPGERTARHRATTDPRDRDVRSYPHRVAGIEFGCVGDIFDESTNPDRKKPFDIRTVMRAVADQDQPPLERWPDMADGGTAVVLDAQLGGHPIALLGVESRPLPRQGRIPADGPERWSAGTLFPQASKKVARAINAASGSRPLVVLANLSGFDGSPESLRERQLEYGAEIGRAVVNFDGPIVFCVISRYHGGAFVVFSKTLNDRMQVLAVAGSRASVIGGAPAAAVVFTTEVDARTTRDPRVAIVRDQLAAAAEDELLAVGAELEAVTATVRAQMLGSIAAEFDAIHDVHRAVAVGSIDRIVAPDELRPRLIDAIERGLATQERGLAMKHPRRDDLVRGVARVGVT